MLSSLLSANVTHKLINIVGTGECGVWSDTESVLYVHFP
ncbi:hypothetical protein SAMN05444678_12063 [Sphingomonas sp. YR710]|nr:hypothetical protein SAMN05444678_12063 [Sphingomonas sp. YR710]